VATEVVHPQSHCDPVQRGQNAFINVTGWSCKDLSTCNTKFKGRQGVLEAGSGSSGSTFKGLVEVLDGLPLLKIFVGENVKEMTMPSSDNRDHMYEILAGHGWTADIQLLEASEYGANVRRPRAWVIAYNSERLGIDVAAAQHMVAQTFSLIKRLKIPPLGLNRFLLKADDKRVVAAEQAAGTKAKAMVAAGSKGVVGGWSSQLAKLLQDNGMRWAECRPSQEVLDSVFFKCLTVREQMALGYGFATVKNATAIDLSQSIGRLYSSDDDILPCITPGCHMMLVNMKPAMRPLLGSEALMLHGASLEWIDSHQHEGESFDEAFLMDLAGNSFVGQVFAAWVCVCVCVCVGEGGVVAGSMCVFVVVCICM